MPDADRPNAVPAPLVALSGWLLPGAGYFLIGEKARAVIAGTTIILTFVLGLLIGGVRVVDVPGYDANGLRKPSRGQGGLTVATTWALRTNPFDEILNKPWYIAQTLVGPVNGVATWGSLSAAANGHHMSTARLFDIGTLYTAVAGMLNLLVILDATYRSTRPPEESPPPEPAGVPSPLSPVVPSLSAAVEPQREPSVRE